MFVSRILLSVCLACAASAALAQGLRGDYDGDGKLSREEFRNLTAREAGSADANGDGVLDSAETGLGDTQIAALGGSNGSIALEAYIEGTTAAFDVLDKNGDGFLDAGEVAR